MNVLKQISINKSEKSMKSRKLGKKALIFITTVSMILLYSIYFYVNSYYIKNQTWLGKAPDRIIIEYSMMGVDLPPLYNQKDITAIISLLRNLKFLMKNPETLQGLGYGIRLEYEDYTIKYYFGSTDRVWIYKNKKILCGYMIDKTVGEKLFHLFEYYAGMYKDIM